MREPGWPHGNRLPATVMWELWKGRTFSCEINQRPFGWALRCYVSGDFHYSRVHPVRFAAQEEAEEKKQEPIAAGWTDRPPMPD
jgi:hypothetical protein